MFATPPLQDQIITYIGNKRRLLPFIYEGVVEILEDAGVWDEQRAAERGGAGVIKPFRFLDAFAGSGVVSRMARIMGMRVHANDLEVYAGPLIRPYLEVDPGEVDGLFSPVVERLRLSGEGGNYLSVLAHLNALRQPASPKSRYFASHYAPQSTAEADPDRERLFYTRENALRIDAILEAVNGEVFEFPAGGPEAGHTTPREIVLASLLYEMSVHVNTSGVMKGYHRGWGGRGRDALSRILSEIVLEPLPFINGPKGVVTTLPAETLFSHPETEEPEIVYADPPYNMHQYGSNYHLLTTAVLGDRYDPGPVTRGSRAGIRRDHNRSAFCRSQRDPATGKRECEGAFERFLKELRGRYLLVSYNTDGLIPPEEMLRLLSENGKHRVSARVQGHVKFKGGKNTQTARRTREVLYRVDIDRGGTKAQIDGVLSLLSREERLGRLLDSYVDPSKLPWRSRPKGRHCVVYYSETDVPLLELRKDFSLREIYAAGAAPDVLTTIEAARVEKLELMDRYVAEGMVDEAVYLLRSFKIRKYREELRRHAESIRRIANPEQLRRLEQLLESYAPSVSSRARRS
ncbi:MAG: DNA adenine methylase [Spirochaetaceae bacterium]